MKKALLILILLVLAGYLLFWPVPVEPVAWDAPETPALEGPYAVNDQLGRVHRLAAGEGRGPEDVAVDKEGRLYVGYEDGRIVRFRGDGSDADLIANTGGRPLGLDFAPDGTLVVADGYQGLLRINAQSGAVTALTKEANGVPFKFTDDVDVASDGVIYFTDASSKFGPAMKARDDIIEHGGHGRLLKYDPRNDTTTVLLDGLQFANGVALAPDESYLLVVETGSYRVLRYWLSGERAGENDVFIDNLPGIPDGISGNGTDTFWVALFAPRNAALDAMADKPLLRKVVFRLPEFMQPQPAHHAFVLGLDTDGNVTHNLQYLGDDAFSPITSVEQVGQRLLLGSLTADSFAIYNLEESQ